jgi:hypothetical protein
VADSINKKYSVLKEIVYWRKALCLDRLQGISSFIVLYEKCKRFSKDSFGWEAEMKVR